MECDTWYLCGTFDGMHRYYRGFTSDDLWRLMYEDPLFDVQGQWFASASYGLLQVIPESLRTTLYSGFSAGDRDVIRQQVFDPRGEYSATRDPERLFDPSICIKLGVVMDAKADVTDELDETLVAGEVPCTVELRWSQCTWERAWKRRFRVFNGGSQGMQIPSVVQYADEIVNDSVSYVPQP